MTKDPIYKVRICHAPLSNRIVVARFGKDPCLALGKKDATSEFFQALVDFAFEGKLPEPGASADVDFGGGDEQFTLTVTRKGAV